jgi:hypothetical protein
LCGIAQLLGSNVKQIATGDRDRIRIATHDQVPMFRNAMSPLPM